MEDRLDGAGNFIPWKARIMLILEENELWDEVVHNTTAVPIAIPPTTNAAVPIAIPPTTDAAALTAFNKKDIKARRIILDVVKDHVIPHISSKTRAYHVKLVATRKVFLHACFLACRRLKIGNQLYLIYFS